MICPNCQTRNRDGARFCDSCGAELPSVAAEAKEMFGGNTLHIDSGASVTIDLDDQGFDFSDQVSRFDNANQFNQARYLDHLDQKPPKIDDDYAYTQAFGMANPPSTYAQDEYLPNDYAYTQAFDSQHIYSQGGIDSYKYGMNPTTELPKYDDPTQARERTVYSTDATISSKKDKKAKKEKPSKPGKEKKTKSGSTHKETKEHAKNLDGHTNKRAVTIAIICALVAIILLALGGTYALGIWGGKPVPNVVGMKAAQAEYQMESAGFRVNIIEVKSDEVEGIVLSTDPAAGKRAEEGSEINLEVSSARVIPEIVGKSLEEALAALSAEGLENIEQVEVKSNETPGCVLSVTPEVGTRCKATSAITIEVAIPYTVPDVTGLSYDEAVEALEAEGYISERTYEYSEDIEEGTVIKTDPEAGTDLNSGSTVTVYVAKSRSAELVQLTRDFLEGSKTFSINGIDYEVSKIDSVEYLEDSTCKYTLTARKYETHSWFGQEPETRYGNNETINGTITFDSSNKVSSSNPSIKQTG